MADSLLTQQDDFDRPDQNIQIQTQGAMLDVIQIVAHLLRFLFETVGISIANLGPTRDAWLDHRTERIKWNAIHEERVIGSRMRSRADEIHVSS